MTKRNIVIVSQFYAPEPCAAAHRIQALAHALAAHGNNVHVIAPHPSFPSGRIETAYRGKFIVREREEVHKREEPSSKESSDITATPDSGFPQSINPIHITRIHHAASAKRGGRILAWGSFAALASCIVAFLPYKPDVIIVSSPPISVGFPGLVGRILRGAKLIVDVRDVFPDLIIQTGIWKEQSLIAKIVGGFARFLYRLAAFVTVVTPTASERVLRRAPFAKVELFPNGADPIEPARDVIPSRQARNDVIPSGAAQLRSRGTEKTSAFIATFAGNMGLANGMDVILDAAKILAKNEHDGDIASRIVLIGGGADYDRVANRIASENISNVDLLGVLPREQAVGALVQSNASIVNLRDGVQESIPTKIFDAFAVGCPVILSAEGEARKLIEETQTGICVQPGNAAALAEAILTLKNNPDLAETYGENGEKIVGERYNREKIMKMYAAKIEEIVLTRGVKE